MMLGTDETIRDVLRAAVTTAAARFQTAYAWPDGTAGTTTKKLTEVKAKNIFCFWEKKNHPWKTATPSIVLREDSFTGDNIETGFTYENTYYLDIMLVGSVYDKKTSYETLRDLTSKTICIIVNYIEDPSNVFRLASNISGSPIQALQNPLSEADILNNASPDKISAFYDDYPLGSFSARIIYNVIVN